MFLEPTYRTAFGAFKSGVTWINDLSSRYRDLLLVSDSGWVVRSGSG